MSKTKREKELVEKGYYYRGDWNKAEAYEVAKSLRKERYFATVVRTHCKTLKSTVYSVYSKKKGGK